MKENDTDRAGEPSLFAHPLAFLVTHFAFPLLAVGSSAYLWWLVRDAPNGVLAAKMLAVLVASAVFPLSAFSLLAFRPKSMNAWLMFAYSFFGAAFLYLSVPVMTDAAGSVDSWIVGPTPMLAVFSGMVPLVFSGIARIATAKWRMARGADIVTSLLCLVVPPAAAFFLVNVMFRFNRFLCDLKLSPLMESIAAHALAIGYFLGCAVFFVGLLRLLHKLFTVVSRQLPEDFRRYAGAAVFGLVLPIAGLSLNLTIPFPADFANPWAWGLAMFSGLVLYLPARNDALGLASYFLKFAAAPFVVYFFVLFIPFLPLAIPAIIAMGAGFLILAPTLLFRYWTRDAYSAYLALRPRFSRTSLVALALAGAVVMPAVFVADVEIERRDLKALLKWHAEEDFDLPPAPMPVPQKRAEKIMKGVNDYTFGAEIPFLTAWRTWRVYDGMYMADKLRNELNLRILGKKVADERDWEGRARNIFGGGLFGANTARRSYDRGARRWWTRRPERADQFTVEARHSGEPGEAKYVVSVKPVADGENCEFVADIALPAGAWIEGMRLKMTNGVWKTARPSERKAAEWVYNRITEQRLDPSIVTLDTPTTGTLKVFPVGREGREMELTVRLPSPGASPCVVSLNGKRADNPLFAGTNAAPSYCTAEGAAVTAVTEAWMEAHANELVAPSLGKAEEFDIDDPELMRKLRRRLREASKAMARDCNGVMPDIRFTVGSNDLAKAVYILSTNVLSKADLAVLRRELPGLASLGDKPLDGWFFMEREGGGKVAVPYRKGDGGAVVFANLKGAAKTGGAWAEGAKAWELENKAFLKPALDVRRELLDLTRKTGTLTTKSAYIAVETSAQEKGLMQKEMESLHGDKSFDFDESSANKSDAPGFFVLLAALAAVFAVSRARSRARRRGIKC